MSERTLRPPPAPLLDRLDGPRDLDALSPSELQELAGQVRERLVREVVRTGGHLGPNLGVVELTIALHRVFDSPRDAIVWDVGHQAYVHKLLTGRAGRLSTLRQAGGLSGYPSPAESPHDVMGDSHASTALSWADGLARAVELGARSGRVVAVVGDGALTGGMAWEALGNLGAAPQRPVVVVLNDNGRSYAPTAGAVAEHLAALRAGSGERGDRRRNVFTDLGLAYAGPVDGHDVAAVQAALAAARDAGRPVLVHVVTRKGAGHPPAEADAADRQHAVPPAVRAGVRSAAPPAGGAPPQPAWTDVAGATVDRLVASRPDVVALTAAMLLPTGLGPAAARAPRRVADVGIAEAHAMTCAAGMATGGLHPVLCLYATFLGRAYDQLLMDVALHRLPVTLVLDRAGVTGPDGASHHGLWDLALLAGVPGVRVAAPRDAAGLEQLLTEAVATGDGPTAVRFPRGRCPRPVPALRRVGRADLLLDAAGADVLVVAVGPLAGAAVEGARALARTGTPVRVADPRWVLPVDDALVELAAAHRLVLTVEDGVAAGGVGDALARALRTAGADTRVAALGLPTAFLAHGEREELLAAAGLDAAGIVAAVRARTASPGHGSRAARPLVRASSA